MKYSNNMSVAIDFNNYFINVAQNLLKDLGDTNNQFQDYLKNEHNFLKETEPQEVFKILGQLSAKKPQMHTDNNKIIKIAANVLKNHLTILFNHSINQGIFPDKLKAGLIHPIYKGETQNQSAQSTDPFLFYLV